MLKKFIMIKVNWGNISGKHEGAGSIHGYAGRELGRKKLEYLHNTSFRPMGWSQAKATPRGVWL